MNARSFRSLLEAKWEEGKFLCVGLDSDYEKIPEAARVPGVRETIVNFNRAIIDATKTSVCAFKPNAAFYEAYGDEGWKALRETIQYIHDEAPGVPVIVDAKRGDIGSTSAAYARAIFDHLHADAVTVQPYLGADGVRPFLERSDKGVFVLCRTSNGSAREFQDLTVGDRPLYMTVADAVANRWNAAGNCGLVVGATYPEELHAVREAAPELPILIPGVGAQGGDLEAAVHAGRDARGQGIIVAASRSILFASAGPDYAGAAAKEAAKLDNAIRAAM